MSDITIRGNLTADPKLRYSQAGKGIASFTVVTSKRVKNRQTQEWEDSRKTFWECTAFDNDYSKLAENITETFRQGMAVVVQGDAYTEPWEGKNGEKRLSLRLMVNDCGPSLRNAQAQVERQGKSERPAEYDNPPF